ncbi:MAG: DUF3127 domain-containing protein [Flavobacteriales bacterium]|nr:DUF3127 domain-containing protein [Flavobacteriales bacterium]
MEVSGKIKLIDETKTFGAKGFRKRDVVVVTSEQYPQSILVEFIQDKCDLLDSYNVGQDVKISINIRVREWTNPQGEVKYFNAIQGWKIEAMSAAPDSNVPPVDASDAFEAAKDISDEDPDDLPF